ncbi:MAG: TonB-dependent receptor [Tannerellaceae bacterium]|jgi:TonB-linked SusC/RagA family outer membrane protein|nr:TonB-dependent receptor [Tannerellaceae bacterium]
MKRKSLLFFALITASFMSISVFSAMGQSNVRVRGVVKSNTDNTPLIGVSVLQTGSSNGTATDLDGNFELTVPTGAGLQFSYLGYITQQITVIAGKTSYEVLLQEDMQALEEVIVVGYGVQKKSVVTAAISRVSSEELTLETPTTVQNALKGKVSGVQITSNSGAPGGDAKIRIRGVGTVNDSNPLYVIDGMPSSNGINYLNPSDIESIEILKDAASAAIYGARGANGVVLVTTKGGKAGKGSFNYEFSYGFQNPEKKSSLMNSSEYQMIMNEMGKNSGRGDKFYFPTPSSTDTDWQEALTSHDAPLVNHRISLSGGSEKHTYYASFGIVDQEGIYAKGYAGYQRYNARLNYSNTLLDTHERIWLNKIVFGSKVGYSRSNLKGSNIGNSEAGGLFASMNMLPPTETIYQDDPAVLAEYATVYPNHIKDDSGRAYNIINMREIVNPFASLKARNNQIRVPQVFNGNFDLTFNLLPGLTYKTTADFEWGYNSDRSITPVYELNTDQTNSASRVYNSLSESFTWQWENILQYNRTWGKHTVNLLAGTTLSSNFYQYINGTRQDLIEFSLDKGFLNISGAADGDARARVYGGASDHKLASVFGRFSYNYDEKYMLEGTVRRDGSSNFGKNNQYAVFPSVSAGWVLTREPFLESRPEWLDVIKVRGSWGQNGNENIGAFGYTSLIQTGDYRAVIDDNVVQGAKPNGYSNPGLKWETSEQTDLGVDLRLFKSFSFSVDYFDKQTKDMLCWMSLPDYAGYASILTNKGNVSNKGWEFDASYKTKVGAVDLSFGANASYVENTVIDQGDSDIPVSIDGLGGGMGGSVTWRANGEPYGFFYGYVHDGIYQNQSEVDKAIQPNAVIGGIRWKDIDGNGKIDGDDRANIGNPNPDWTYGLTLSAQWKGFDLNAFMQGVAGNQIYKLYRRGNVTRANFDKAWLNRWHGEGTSNWLPIIAEGNTVEGKETGANTVSNLYVEDGDYFRLKVLQLGYTLPASLTKKVLISRLRLFAQGENVFTVTDYSGLDPEVGTRNAFDGGTYPQPRTFTLGVNLTF